MRDLQILNRGVGDIRGSCGSYLYALYGSLNISKQ